jgi:hypothetical protein
MTYHDGQWVFPSSGRVLNAQEIHVWRVTLNQPNWLVEHLRQWLAPNEQAQAGRFHFDHDRAHFVGRGALRSILSGYLGTGRACQALGHLRQFRGEPALVALFSRARIELRWRGGCRRT